MMCRCGSGEGHERGLTVGDYVTLNFGPTLDEVPRGTRGEIREIDVADCTWTFRVSYELEGEQGMTWAMNDHISTMTVPEFNTVEEADAFLDDPDRWMEEYRDRKADAR